MGCECQRKTITFPFDLGLTYPLSLTDILFSGSPRCQYLMDPGQIAEAMCVWFALSLSRILSVFMLVLNLCKFFGCAFRRCVNFVQYIQNFFQCGFFCHLLLFSFPSCFMRTLFFLNFALNIFFKEI